MLAYHLIVYIDLRHVIAMLAITAFTVFYWFFDLQGGLFRSLSYPLPNPMWISLPTIEGIACAIGIAWHDNSFVHLESGLSKFVGRLGEYSYSIYLLHFLSFLKWPDLSMSKS